MKRHSFHFAENLAELRRARNGLSEPIQRRLEYDLMLNLMSCTPPKRFAVALADAKRTTLPILPTEEVK